MRGIANEYVHCIQYVRLSVCLSHASSSFYAYNINRKRCAGSRTYCKWLKRNEAVTGAASLVGCIVPICPRRNAICGAGGSHVVLLCATLFFTARSVRPSDRHESVFYQKRSPILVTERWAPELIPVFRQSARR